MKRYRYFETDFAYLVYFHVAGTSEFHCKLIHPVASPNRMSVSVYETRQDTVAGGIDDVIKYIFSLFSEFWSELVLFPNC